MGGGAYKACNLFCHVCACQSYGANCQLLKWQEGYLRCKEFCLCQEEPPSKCYHLYVDDEEEVNRKNSASSQ